jgi:hypothetical protein
LNPLAESGVQGAAALEPCDDVVQVTLDVEGLQPGVEYQARLYAGTAEAPSASFGLLGALTADEAGRAWLQASQMQGTGTGQMVDLTHELLAGWRALHRHLRAGCGQCRHGFHPASRAPCS